MDFYDIIFIINGFKKTCLEAYVQGLNIKIWQHWKKCVLRCIYQSVYNLRGSHTKKIKQLNIEIMAQYLTWKIKPKDKNWKY